MSELLKLQLAQEEYRLRNTSYGSIADLGFSSNSEYYDFSVADLGAETYTLTATAKGAQAADTDCASMTLNHNDQKSPVGCWQ